ncbi:MAG: hypothetical protein V1856_01215 [Candidatus Liptonbacteria bacterium]
MNPTAPKSWREIPSRVFGIVPWRKISSMLRITPVIGGLEVSDTSLRYASWDGVRWYLTVLRLPEGLMQGGRIQDPVIFRQALRQLKSQIDAIQGGQHRIDVAVSLSSVSVYSQVFSLPVIKEENLDSAVQLNIQMASPKKDSENYSGWQLVGEDQSSVRLEILSAFIERGLVDSMVGAFKDAGFYVHSVESRAASLARVIREMGVGFDIEKSYLVLSVDSSGMEFVVIRRGNVYFQYFLPWQDVYGAEKQISQEKFIAEVMRSVHQVLNFYNTHWNDPLAGLYIAASSLAEELTNIVQNNFSIRVLNLELNFPQKVGPAWFVAIGTGLRGMTSPRNDKEISLLGISAQEEYRRGLVLRFLEFWRVLLPVTLGILLLVLVGGDVFLRQTLQAIEKNDTHFSPGERQVGEIAELQKKASIFNESVSQIGMVTSSREPRYEAVSYLKLIMDESDVDLVRMVFPGFDTRIDINGESPSLDKITAFASRLRSDGRLSEVNLASRATPNKEKGNYSFSISFKMSPKTR